MKNLREFNDALVLTKAMVANATDGNVVGKDSVSGGDYFNTMPTVGTMFKTPKGKLKVIVDAIAYPKHVTKGTTYQDEIKFIALTVDADTLDFTGERKNIGFDYLTTKCEIVDLRCYKFLYDLDQATVVAKQELDASFLNTLKKATF